MCISSLLESNISIFPSFPPLVWMNSSCPFENGHGSRPKLPWQWFVWRESGPICSLSTGDVGLASQSPAPPHSPLTSPLPLNTQREDNENRERVHRTTPGSMLVWAPASPRLVPSSLSYRLGALAGRMWSERSRGILQMQISFLTCVLLTVASVTHSSITDSSTYRVNPPI